MIARKNTQIALLSIVLAFVIKGALAVNDQILNSMAAEPVSIVVPEKDIIASYISRTGIIHELKSEIKDQWIKKLVFHVPDDSFRKSEKVTVIVGKKKYELAVNEFIKEPGPQGMVFLTPQKSCLGNNSFFPVAKELINWPGDKEVVKAVFLRVFSSGFIILAVILFMSGILMRRKKFRPVLDAYFLKSISKEKVPLNKLRSHWLLAGFAFLVLSLFLLERMEPFYFTQADNYATELPVMLYTLNSIEKGVFPEWNPHQFLGSPIVSLGTSGVFYPPRYIAFYISKYLIGNEYLVIEILMILHLLIGFFAVFFLLRSLGIRDMLSSIGSLSFILSGYNLIAGRSAEIMMPMIVWTPLLFLCFIKLAEEKKPKYWVLLTGLVIGVFFHAGNSQVWIYSMGFVFLFLVLMIFSGRINIKRALWSIPAGLLGLVFAAPVLLVQLLEFRTILRTSMGGDGIYRGILSMLLPSPLVNANSPYGTGSANLDVMGQFYYSGTIFAVVGFLGVIILFMCLLAYNTKKKELAQFAGTNIWMVCFILAFVLALGNEGVITGILARLPIFNKLRGPGKFLPFVNLFMIISAGIIMEKYLRRSKKTVNKSAVLACLTLLLLLYHVSISRASLYTYNDMPPYPNLPDELSILRNGRVISISPHKSTVPDYIYALNNNFATVYGILSFDGYHDQQSSHTLEYIAVSERFNKDPVAAAKAYGINWIIIHKTALEPVLCSNPNLYDAEKITEEDKKIMEKLAAVSREKLVLPYMTVREIEGVEPMAFSGRESLPVIFSAAGAMVKVSTVLPSQTVIVNVLWRPWMKAYLDGIEVRCSRDNWGRSAVKCAATSNVLLLKYSPPWGRGIALSLLLLVFCILVYCYVNSLTRKRR
ncbi:MAG: hypothetical protein A2231_07150 [Candidatus Firestonebacteria bacterium RIFOXYA2_FULL_40_8]|nr:MAG: hypothetical protein A2231_07150 [Candidatus Firestonebacteria bacterium RIFOXYA2_FULL_40_8]